MNYKDKHIKCYACINKNEQIRTKSSSGGIFTLLAEQILTDNGVVFGAGFNNKFEVEHSYIEDKKDLDRFRGSKYVQSDIGKTYEVTKKFLEEGRKVLFSGTPCQIGGLKSYLKRSYKNLFCIEIVCHGVPSPAVWKKYIEYREEIAQSPVQRICFRNKNKGWKMYSMSFWFRNNTEYRQSLNPNWHCEIIMKDPRIKRIKKLD